MKELYNLGLSDKDINSILNAIPEIKELEKYEITNNINILKQINCNDIQIRNIITANPYFLNRIPEDILSLINVLQIYKINNLNLLFDSNPFLLNKDIVDIENHINNELKSGKTLSEIIDEFQLNPYKIDEIKGE